MNKNIKDMDNNILEQIKSINKLYDTNFESINQHDILSNKDTCFFRNKKCDKYYVHTYDPSIIPDIAKNISNSKKNEKCCNCVSFVLYKFLSDDMTEDVIFIYKYLYSLNISVINITDCLDNFIAKIYLDISVFSNNLISLKYIHDNNVQYDNNPDHGHDIMNYYVYIDKILSFLLKHPQVEIYIYTCAKNTENIRSLRFIPLTDTETNIKIIRDADGYVSYIDCINIKKFIEQKKILFIYGLTNSNHQKSTTNILENKNAVLYDPYSLWIKLYLYYDSFFKNNIPVCDILAGLFGCAIQIRSDVYIECIHKINKFCDIIEPYKSINRDYIKAVNIGYDEIVLLDLFKSLICLKRIYIYDDETVKNDIESTIDKYMSKDKSTMEELLQEFAYDPNTYMSNIFFKIFKLNKIYNDQIEIIRTYIAYVENKIEIKYKYNTINYINNLNNFFIENKININNLEQNLDIFTNHVKSVRIFGGADSLFVLMFIDSLLKHNKISFDKISNILFTENKNNLFLFRDDKPTVLSTIGLSNFKPALFNASGPNDDIAKKLYTKHIEELKGGYLKYIKYYNKMSL